MRFIEATNGFNWGKFGLRRFTDEEWQRPSALEPGRQLLAGRGWSARDHMLILDLQTGEGAVFAPRPGGHPGADLNKKKIWVCPLFEPFLTWLYSQDLTDLDALPSLVELPDAPSAMYGYRREGNPTGHTDL